VSSSDFALTGPVYLLKRIAKRSHFGSVVRRAGPRDELRAERVANEIEHGVVGELAAGAGGGDGGIDHALVVGLDRIVEDVGPVDGNSR